jgi:hypothetical protein
MSLPVFANILISMLRLEFPTATPAGVSVQNPIIVPVAGVVSSGETASLPLPLVPRGAITGTVPDGTFIRATFHIEGKLLGGSSVHTSEREYLFEACTADPLCPVNACL